MTDKRKSTPREAIQQATTREEAETAMARASIKEAVGKLTGDVKAEFEGKAEKNSSTSEGQSGSARRS